MNRPGSKRPQLYHGVGDKPMNYRSWDISLKSDNHLRQPLLHRDRMRMKLKLIVSKHINRLKRAA